MVLGSGTGKACLHFIIILGNGALSEQNHKKKDCWSVIICDLTNTQLLATIMPGETYLQGVNPHLSKDRKINSQMELEGYGQTREKKINPDALWVILDLIRQQKRRNFRGLSLNVLCLQAEKASPGLTGSSVISLSGHIPRHHYNTLHGSQLVN